MGIYDEEKKASPSSTSASQFESSSGLDPVTYDALVNYLDYELPRRQQVNLEQKPAPIATSPVTATTTAATHKRIQPRPLAPAPPVTQATTASTTSSTTAASPTPTVIAPAPPRQVLMPKPPVINANILASLLATAAANTSAPAQQQQQQRKSSIAPAPLAPVKRALAEVEEETTEEIQNPDEDKRRRNTAASARFRVKKKMREQAMEQSVREMTLKSDHLQDRVNNLEAEIKFLRSLLLDKAAEKL